MSIQTREFENKEQAARKRLEKSEIKERTRSNSFERDLRISKKSR